ncbi:hypothetical protein BOTBODRAFT_178797 [Botryobasidium botryosum FD-172 SS1]|uniref:Uncharacterized protein n=1 Tax=Botryobasidium botryosum (strain FD-172 SS1) TaxID=930990 RepID=A0A067M2D1_BOTB1|nr:hypothetical protein BOTBODRAFT_178797 [Botryobasidium botryosum FD-172 SS1]
MSPSKPANSPTPEEHPYDKYLRELQKDQDTVFEKDATASWKYVLDNEGRHGCWSAPHAPNCAAVVRVFGQTSYTSQIGPYGNHSWEQNQPLTYSSFVKAKLKIDIGAPAGASPLAVELFKGQARNLVELQPLANNQFLGKAQAIKKPYKLHSLYTTLVHPRSREVKTYLRLTMDRMWASPHHDSDRLPSDIFADKEALPGKEEEPHAKEVTSISMADWPDPLETGLNRFPNADRTFHNLVDFRGIDGKAILPQDLEKALKPGTWILADCKVLYWDMTGKKFGNPSVTYQLLVEALQVVKPSTEQRPSSTSFVYDRPTASARVSPLKRSLGSQEHALSPCPKRAFPSFQQEEQPQAGPSSSPTPQKIAIYSDDSHEEGQIAEDGDNSMRFL